MPGVAGVCVVQNAIDILPALIGHYLRLGFGRLLFLDDGSADGTFELLTQLSRADGRIQVAQVVLRKYGQAPLVTEHANALLAQGFEYVFPFDSDEFWNLDLRGVLKFAQGRPACLFVGAMVQFAQDRGVRRGDPLGLLRVAYRAPALATGPWPAVELTGSQLCFTKPKVGFRSRRPVSIAEGCHKATLDADVARVAGLEVFHFMMRSRDQLDARAARRTWGGAAGVGVSPAERAACWAANSVRNGCLDTSQGPFPVTPDRRLRTLLVRGLAWFALRHPLLLARVLLICRRPLGARRWALAGRRAGPPATLAAAE